MVRPGPQVAPFRPTCTLTFIGPDARLGLGNPLLAPTNSQPGPGHSRISPATPNIPNSWESDPDLGASGASHRGVEAGLPPAWGPDGPARGSQPATPDAPARVLGTGRGPGQGARGWSGSWPEPQAKPYPGARCVISLSWGPGRENILPGQESIEHLVHFGLTYVGAGCPTCRHNPAVTRPCRRALFSPNCATHGHFANSTLQMHFRND